jgi:hypothetical protein
MAINTYQTYLMTSDDGSTYTKLLDIKSFPDLMGGPNNLETTTLSDEMKTYIPGLKDPGDALEFGANYTAADFAAVEALEGTEKYYAVWIGASGSPLAPDGSKGKFSFKGYAYATKNGAGTDEVQDMTVGIIPSTPITFAAS